ncbi:helix-turn-helix transcriptional regulator [Gelidibacter pelagius]|uniref:Helix-turn-helix transcriptional regulator n=1 Tax=Gelidibacter pelagius TaxID=2819985 RepID=A0ABS3SRK6_9FLAO|nr:AraC family transcriptional regulator [Gelidibacter pelagius]MBO3098339.1 helix-turn-helix transcriptional regulator [Gelidibacter pelagius]
MIELDRIVYNVDLYGNKVIEDRMSTLSVQKELNNESEISSHLIYTKGLCLIDTSIKPQQQLTDQITVTEDYVQIFCMMDGCSVGKQSCNEKCQFNLGIMHLVYCKGLENTLEIASQKKSRYLSVVMSRSYYLILFFHEPWIQHSKFYRSVMEQKTVGHGEITFPLDSLLKRVLNELMLQAFPKRHAKHLTDLKLKELFLHILIKFSEAMTNKTAINKDEYEKLEAAKAYLTLHFDHPPTAKQLSRIVFLNELKLKQGFKQLYNTSIYAYVIKLKMEKAEIMLAEKHTVQEMAEILGYKSVSHFISTFKKTFGYTPKQGLMERNEKLTSRNET